jgi:hypothetical protein
VKRRGEGVGQASVQGIGGECMEDVCDGVHCVLCIYIYIYIYIVTNTHMSTNESNNCCGVKYLNVVTTANDPKETANQRVARILSSTTHGPRHAGRKRWKPNQRATPVPVTNSFG